MNLILNEGVGFFIVFFEREYLLCMLLLFIMKVVCDILREGVFVMILV